MGPEGGTMRPTTTTLVVLSFASPAGGGWARAAPAGAGERLLALDDGHVALHLAQEETAGRPPAAALSSK